MCPSCSYWPTYPAAEVTLPAEIAAYTDVFTQFYLSKHGGRRLAWQHSLGQCVLRGRFAAVGARELQVSLFQAAALLLFNDAPRLSLAEVRACAAVARAWRVRRVGRVGTRAGEALGRPWDRGGGGTACHVGAARAEAANGN